MANDTLKHVFHSGKADGADATQVQPSNWNDGHRFSGGASGDHLVRNVSDPYGAAFQPFSYVFNLNTGGGNIPGGYDNYVCYLNAGGSSSLYYLGPNAGTAFKAGARLTLINQGGLVCIQPMNGVPGQFMNRAKNTYATNLAPWNGNSGSGGAATYIWDGNATWIMVTHEQAGPAPMNLNGGHCIGFSPGIFTNDMTLVGRDMRLHIMAENCSVTGGSQTLTIGPLPFQSSFKAGTGFPFFSNFDPDALPGAYTNCVVTINNDVLTLYTPRLGPWPAMSAWYFFMDLIIPVL